MTRKLPHDCAMCGDERPLEGRRILLTRAAGQLPALAAQVAALGGVGVDFPCLQVEALPEQVASALRGLDVYSDVLLTSAHGVRAVADAAAESSLDLAALFATKRVAAVGRRTAQALEALGVRVDLVPEDASQAGVVAAYDRSGWPIALLFFRAEEGQDRLLDAAAARGVPVTLVAAYRTTSPDDEAESAKVRAMLAAGEIDAVLLGSPKAARFFLKRVGASELANRAAICVISETVAQTARALGLRVQVVAKAASFERMLVDLAGYFAASAEPGRRQPNE